MLVYLNEVQDVIVHELLLSHRFVLLAGAMDRIEAVALNRILMLSETISWELLLALLFPFL